MTDIPHRGTFYYHLNTDLRLGRLNHFPIPRKALRVASRGVVRGVGRALVVGGIAYDGYAIYSAAPGAERAEAIGGVVGSWGGAAVGAAIGSAIVPGVGTVVGGVVGAIVGGFAGEAAGRGFYD